MAKPIEYNATVLERVDLTDKLAIFRVKPDRGWGGDPAGAGQIPDFEGGQYAVLGLNHPTDPEKGSVLRPYSIASPPEEKRFLEFYVRYVDLPESKNPLTHLLWDLKSGDRIYLGRKITGHFTLSRTIGEDDPRLRVFVAAGTGLAPFVSILASCVQRGLDPSRFAVLHGVSRAEDLGYREDLLSVFGNLPDRYAPTISRPGENPNWTGCIGRVESFFDHERLSELEARLGLEEGGLTPDRAVVFICGLYGTIHHTLLRLMRRGFVPNDRRIREGLGLLDQPPTLFFEQYDSAPVLDVRNKAELEILLAETPFIKNLRQQLAT